MANMQNPRSRTGIVSANTQVKPVMQGGGITPGTSLIGSQLNDAMAGTAVPAAPSNPGSMLPGMAGNAMNAPAQGNIWSTPNKTRPTSKPGQSQGNINPQTGLPWGQHPGMTPQQQQSLVSGGNSKNSYGQQPGSTPGSKNSYGQQPGQAPGMMNAMGAMGGYNYTSPQVADQLANHPAAGMSRQELDARTAKSKAAYDAQYGAGASDQTFDPGWGIEMGGGQQWLGGGQPGSLIDMQENPYNGTSFFGGNNEPPMGPMPPAGNQGGSGGFQSPNPYQNPYAGRVSSTGGGSSRPRSTYDTSVGGVSAVNPQGGTMDKWVDEAYSNAMTRLNPQMDQQKASFDQAMVDRGIPVGSEAYNKALQQMDMNQNDARQNAMFNAMGFGRDTQQQMFGQDAQRSQLANALLQARMGNELQWDNSAMNWENMGNQWNYAWDRANQSDLSWLDNMNFRDRSYNDQQDWMQYNARNAMLGAIPGWNPMQIDVNGSANQAYNSQYGNANLQNQQNQNFWNQLMDIGGMGAGMYAMSDRRLKEDITPIGVIDGVNIYTWEWNDEAKRLGVGDEPRIGVIAQEVPAQFTTVRDGYLAVNYDGLFGGV